MIKPIIYIILLCLALSCKNKNPIQVEIPSGKIDSVHFITHSYIETEKIQQISKFRSGIGHDYWDDAEHCRSMKHYFQPFDSLDWSKVKIYAPVTGKIVFVVDEGMGMQIKIEPAHLSYYNIIIFHVILSKPLAVGDSVKSGQLLGTHYSNATYFDIAISSSITNQYLLLSYFDVLPDSLLTYYYKRGPKQRSDFIISKEARDADPLNCTGETFGTEGTLENWVYLK